MLPFFPLLVRRTAWDGLCEPVPLLVMVNLTRFRSWKFLAEHAVHHCVPFLEYSVHNAHRCGSGGIVAEPLGVITLVRKLSGFCFGVSACIGSGVFGEGIHSPRNPTWYVSWGKASQCSRFLLAGWPGVLL